MKLEDWGEVYDDPSAFETYYRELTDVGRLIFPMSENEFVRFLHKDKYGNDDIDKDSILSLLNLILNKKGFEDKEYIILKILANDKLR